MVNKKELCPITRKVFECKTCKAVGEDGECPYMKLDEWSDNTLRTMRELAKWEVEREYAKKKNSID